MIPPHRQSVWSLKLIKRSRGFYYSPNFFEEKPVLPPLQYLRQVEQQGRFYLFKLMARVYPSLNGAIQFYISRQSKLSSKVKIIYHLFQERKMYKRIYILPICAKFMGECAFWRIIVARAAIQRGLKRYPGSWKESITISYHLENVSWTSFFPDGKSIPRRRWTWRNPWPVFVVFCL